MKLDIPANKSSTSTSNVVLSSTAQDLAYCYSAYGLIIKSELVLPQLMTGSGEAAITIRYGKVPDSIEDVTHSGLDWQASPQQFLLHKQSVARYLAQENGEVIIDRAPAADDSDIRVFLLGSVLGFLLHQRQILPLHASAIHTQRGAVLFTGHSGAGKSTTVSAMVQHGYPMLADDVSGIILDDKNHPLVLPSFPSSRLWADSAAQLKRSTSGMSRVRASLDKYLFPVEHFCQEAVPLLGVYVLTPHDQPTIELQPIESTIDKFTWLLANTYRKIFVSAVGWRQEQFQLISNMLQTVYVTRVMRPTHSFLLDELVEQIKEDFNSKALTGGI